MNKTEQLYAIVNELTYPQGLLATDMNLFLEDGLDSTVVSPDTMDTLFFPEELSITPDVYFVDEYLYAEAPDYIRKSMWDAVIGNFPSYADRIEQLRDALLRAYKLEDLEEDDELDEDKNYVETEENSLLTGLDIEDCEVTAKRQADALVEDGVIAEYTREGLSLVHLVSVGLAGNPVTRSFDKYMYERIFDRITDLLPVPEDDDLPYLTVQSVLVALIEGYFKR